MLDADEKLALRNIRDGQKEHIDISRENLITNRKIAEEVKRGAKLTESNAAVFKEVVEAVRSNIVATEKIEKMVVASFQVLEKDIIKSLTEQLDRKPYVSPFNDPLALVNPCHICSGRREAVA